MLSSAGRKAASRGWAGKFLDWIYLFQAIFRNLGFSWQKSFPHPRNYIRKKCLDSIYKIQAIFSNFWFNWRKSTWEPNRETFYTGFINFRQFLASFHSDGRNPLWCQIWNIFRQDLSISGNFQQLWIELTEKPCPPELNKVFFLDWICPFQAFSYKFGFSWQKSSPHQSNRGKWFRLDLFILSNFQQLWVQLSEKPLPGS